MSRKLSIAGNKYGRLTAIHPVKSKSHGIVWLFECECGKQKECYGWEAKNGTVQSCGCLRRKITKERSQTHGLAGTKTYTIWSAMKRRCYNKNCSDYHNYGGRGIQVCKRWKNSFENFLEDMGEQPKNCSIERIDNNKGYSPTNCKWATKKEQARNRRTNVLIEFEGRTMCLLDWSKELNLNYKMLMYRIESGWKIKKAFTTPSRKKK